MIKVGSDGAVCVKDQSGYGVVHGGESGISCATCRFNKRTCPHVLRVVDLIKESELDVPEFLQPLSLCIDAAKSKKSKAPLASLQSTKPIPFTFPSTIANVLKLPFTERFQIVDGSCHLSEAEHCSPCSLCGSSTWETEYAQSTVIITQHQILPGLGRC